MSHAIAIDFGTSRTKAAYWDKNTGKPQLMHLGYRNELFLPSLFYLPAGTGDILWGDQAEAKIEDDPAGIVDVLKRRLQERYIYRNRRKVTPQALLMELLSGLRRRAGAEVAAFGGQPPVKVLLTVPALYGPAFQKLVEDAAQETGFTDIDLVPEPVAAARAWLAETGENGREVVVLDCGGGTLDWAFMRYDNGNFHLVPDCPAGCDTHVGGYDVDLELLNELRDRTEDPTEIEQRQPYYLNEICHLKERYCRSLDLRPVKVGGRLITLDGTTIQAVLDSRFVHQAVENLRSYLAKVEQVCPKAQPTILLVGGSARIKGLKNAIEEQTGRKTLWWERSEFATVLGASLVNAYALDIDNDARSNEVNRREFMKEKKYCIQCGTEPPGIARFCSSCGMLQTDEEQQLSEKHNLRNLASNSDMTLSRPWNYVAPEYRKFLLELHYLIKTDFPGSSINELLSAGLVSIGLEGIFCNSEALIAARRYQELKHIDQTYPGQLPDYLHKFLEHGDIAEICKDELNFEPKKIGLTEVLFLSQVCEQPRKAQEHLAELTRVYIESVSQERSYSNYLKRKRQGLDDLPYVSICDLVDVAKCWGLVFGDETQARRCLQIPEIEEVAEITCSDWLHLAEGWLVVFDDAVQARRCLDRANAEAKATSDWIDCGFHWRKLLADDRKAYQALTKAVACIPEALQSKLESYSSYREHLSRSGRGNSYLRCAQAWKFVLDEEHQALHCIEEAETAASSPYLLHPSNDWCDIADTWLNLFNDDQNAIRCLEQAEATAKDSSVSSTSNWCEIANVWHNLNDNQNAIRCLEQAEATAQDSGDWYSCGYAWQQLKDQRKADRCRKRAEAFKEMSDDDSGII